MLQPKRSEPRPPLVWRAGLLGLQHVLSMDVYVVPFVIGAALGLPGASVAGLVAACFLAAGIASLVQSQFCLRRPVMQGPSYVPIGAVTAIAAASGGGMAGLGTAFTALIPGAILLAMLGWPLRLFHRVVGRLVPPLVGGAIISVIGITLMPVAIQGDVLQSSAGGATGGSILLAAVSAAISVLASTAGIALGRRGGTLRAGSVLLSLAGGSLLAWGMGRLDISPVARAPWLQRPLLLGFGLVPHLSLSAVLTMLLVYAVVLAETTGTWLALSAVTGQGLEPRDVDRGAFGEGLGCLVSALLGSVPVTGYASNAGVVALTGVASRRVFGAAALVLIGFGLCGKLASAIACVPAPVIGGMFGVLCVVILMNGLRILAGCGLDERGMMVAGLPILLGLFATLLPRDVLAGCPLLAREMLGSAVGVGAASAILLNLILPRRPATAAASTGVPVSTSPPERSA